MTGRHSTEAELIAGLARVREAPADGGMLVQIVVRLDAGGRELPVACEVTPEDGLLGDRWARTCKRRLPDGRPDPDTPLTLMNVRFLGQLVGAPERWSLAGDNLLVDLDLSEANLPIGQRLRIGAAVVEITAHPHTGCAKFAQRFGTEALRFVNAPEGRLLRLRGANAQVVAPGRITTGDRIEKAR